jgi:hypothetical protein
LLNGSDGLVILPTLKSALPSFLSDIVLSELEPTFTLPKATVVGVTVICGAVFPDCVTVNTFPPVIVMVPVLSSVLVLAETEYFTAPPPLPLLPEVMLIQDALVVAVQGQPPGALTLILPVSSPEPCERSAGEIE